MISSKIRQKIQELSIDYYSRLQVIENKAHQLLEYSQAGTHLSFTPHGLSHISAVERNYDWLLLDKDLDTLNASELFCLVCATFFHDALMIPKKLGDELAARQEHIDRAHVFLHKNRDFLGILIPEAEAISQVIRAHGVYDFDEIPEQTVLGSELVNLHKLGACLSLADICHADSSRAPEIVFRHLDLDEESSFHWRRHMQIAGITRKDDELIMSALIFSEQGRVAVTEYKEIIEEQLNIVRPYFDTVLTPIKRVELIIRKLDSPLDQTLQFQTNTPAILSLLIDGVYDRVDVFVRELVQNSLDSCLLHKAKQQRRNLKYEPQILLTIFIEDDNIKALRIDDNGIGMDVSDVQDTVLWIGNSISSREDVTELLQKTLGKNLIAKFGIGLLSCFKASNNITVRTRKENETGLEFKLTGVSDNIKLEKAKDDSIGTTIIIEVSNEKVKLLDPDETISYYFRMINQANLKKLYLDWDPAFVAASRTELFKIAVTEADSVEYNHYYEDDDDLSYLIQGDDYSGAVWLTDWELNKVIGSNGNVTILNEGIYVTREPITEWFPSFMYFCEATLNFSSKSITLPAGRDRVIRDDKFNAKVKELSERSFGLIRTLVEQTKSKNSKERDFAALILARMFYKASKFYKERLFRHLDEYNVRTFRQENRVTLSELKDPSYQPIYIHYPVGKWVKELTVVDGKQLWHKEDDFVELQAAILTQESKLVLSTARYDDEEAHLESDLVKAYLTSQKINHVDLTKINVISGKQRSKPVPTSVRQQVGANTKFIEITGLPNKKSWNVGSELWINLANPTMRRIYNTLQSGNLDEDQIKCVAVLFSLLAHNYDKAVSEIANWLDR